MKEYEILTRSLKDSAASSKLKLLKEGEAFGVEKPGGEKRIHIGSTSEQEEWDRFFFPNKESSFNVIVSKTDLIKYMIEAKGEYLNPHQSYRLRISDFYDDLYKQTLEIPQESFEICFEKNTDNSRYYVTRPSNNDLSKNYKFIIDICLPIVTKFVFLRVKDDSSYIFYLRPEFRPDFITPELIEKDSKCDNNLQQIFYGAPGTGKSHRIKDDAGVKEADKKDLVFRTTFYPDSDYSTFVGCYKPNMDKDGVSGEEKIVYSFIPQVFTDAYVAAWRTDENVYLIIEEINRGNCAQIFGDLFQLLDRDEEGYSKYEIKPDADLMKYIAGCKLDISGVNNSNGKDISGKITSGELLKLPKNLYIWATMNTSDQSLFPIDSAFKRRWEWEYIPINYNCTESDYTIVVDKDHTYKWPEFLEEINKHIYDTTKSEDKQMGNFFVSNVKKMEISCDQFVSKVMFYLWNDICKDNPTARKKIYSSKPEEGKEDVREFKFSSLFPAGEERNKLLIGFMAHLEINNIADSKKE